MAKHSKVSVRIPVNLAKLAGQGATPEMIQEALEKTAGPYYAFLRTRFEEFSAGGGDWAPLAESTLERRRHGSGSGDDQILRDTGGLMRSINNLGQYGGKQEISGTTLVFSFAPVQHGPDSAGRPSKGTYAAIAAAHQEGNPDRNLPQRKIIVPPDEETKEQMKAQLLRVIKKHITGGS